MDSNSIYVPKPGSNSKTAAETANTVQRTQNQPKMTGKKVEKISKYGLYTLVYAVFTAFCLYKNHRGITFPFFAFSTVVYYDLCLRKMEGKWQRKDIWYPIAIILLGLSVFLTEDKQMTGLAKCTIAVLIGIYGLHILYDETEWRFMRYIQALIQLIGGTVEHFVSAFSETSIFLQNIKNKEEKCDEEGNPLPKKNSKIIYVGIGILISIPLVAIILTLLCKADAVFKEAVDRILEFIDLENIIGVLITILFVFILSYAIVRYLDEKSIKIEDKEHHVFEPVLAITVTSIITVIYLFFCGIQVVYLTFGNYLTLPEGYTYAQYAHEGFYELLTVCILNLAIVLVTSYFFGESKVLKTILTVICVCTYVMIASSAYRMILYVREYDLTRLRVYVLYGLIVLAILLAGVIIYIFRESFPLFRYGIAILTAAVIILVFSHPTALIARYNIYQMTEKHRVIDIKHLCRLGTDAIPVILDNFDELYEYELAHYDDRYDEDLEYFNNRSRLRLFYEDSFGTQADIEDYDSPSYDMSLRSFNLSRYFAQKANKKTNHKYDKDSEFWDDIKADYLSEGSYSGELL